jgi:predicted MFS family arabinose efflux permease
VFDLTDAAAAPSYFRFAANNRRFLAFGLIMTFGSCFGQTHFIGVFGPSIQAEFDLSHASWGTIYMVGTLMSAALLPFTGRWIDRIALRRYALLVCFGLAIACLVAAAAPAAWFLVIVVFLLRQTGQGLASHTAITGMVKYFRHNRGKAIALALQGHPIARAVMPLAAVVAIAEIGWRETYVVCALLAVLIMVPIIAWVLHGRVEDRLFDPQMPKVHAGSARPTIEGDRSLSQLLRDPFFWLVVPGVLAPAVIDTALFFHQLTIADMKGWSPQWVTAGYIPFAAAMVVVSIAMGPLVDRIGAIRLLPTILLPLIVGILVLAFFDDPIWAWVYLAVSGFASGVRATIVPAMWAERCGARHIGAIKSLVTTLSVFGSAFGPPLMGWAMDAGIALDTMIFMTVAYMAVASVGLCFASRLRD